MNINEKVSYIKGLAEGLKLDESKAEGKVLLSNIDLLSDMADEIQLLSEDYDSLSEFTDEINEALEEVEDDFYGEDDSEYDDDEDIAVCPECGEENYLSLEDYEKGSFTCCECEKEFKFSDDCCSDDDCDCCKH